MICRTWRGWTTLENADAYESVVRGEVIPGIEAMQIRGFRHIDLMRRELGDEVEFMTVMWFDDIDSIKAFVGEDYSISHVPAAARAVLVRHDERSAHYVVLDQRPQPPVGS
ncbi:MAG: antibiotic biosynthesis monooxygenase [Jiangellaceae bacterium]